MQRTQFANVMVMMIYNVNAANIIIISFISGT